ncbi:dephospho-CoA kinase [candidate division WOR-3 bacterium]|nr:dephospho-CoA kinase [candidate division WOR-3 bacterium]
MHHGDKVIIGVGGNIGSGKTLVSKIFEELGAHYISADEIGWEVLPDIADELRERFGSIIMDRDIIDKEKLRSIVFSNSENLDYLNKLSHPLLVEKILKKIEEIKSKVVVIDAALIFDWSELRQVVDYPILVVSDNKVKEGRVMKRGINKLLFRQILESQKSEAEMSRQAKFIIENNSTVDILRSQCQNIYKEIENDCRMQ